MHKDTLWTLFVLLIIYFMLVFFVLTSDAAQQHSSLDSSYQQRSLTAVEESRRRHSLYKHAWGWHALAIAYWIKVKLVIVAFFVGSAIFVGLRYFWPHKCHSEIIKEGPIVYDHPPSFASYHDHGPYSSSSSFDHDSIPYSYHGGPSFFDHAGSNSFSVSPFSGYAGSLGSDVVPSTAPDTLSSLSSTTSTKRRIRRSPLMKRQVQQEQEKQQPTNTSPHPQRPILPSEQQIGEFMFYFLGLDTAACRRRFICEMEFRARLHPLTNMAFRMVGHTFFEKYRNEYNLQGRANSFGECGAVNPECVFIENNDPEEEEQSLTDVDQSNSLENAVEIVNENKNNSTKVEEENTINLEAERKSTWKPIRKNRRPLPQNLRNIAQRLFASNMDEN